MMHARDTALRNQMSDSGTKAKADTSQGQVIGKCRFIRLSRQQFIQRLVTKMSKHFHQQQGQDNSTEWQSHTHTEIK